MRQTAAMILLTLFMITAGLPAQIHEPETYEEAIGNFLEEDQASPPEPGGILFLGSSSIRMWDLEKWFPEMNTLNRGYGGSYISDSIYYADRILRLQDLEQHADAAPGIGRQFTRFLVIAGLKAHCPDWRRHLLRVPAVEVSLPVPRIPPPAPPSSRGTC